MLAGRTHRICSAACLIEPRDRRGLRRTHSAVDTAVSLPNGGATTGDGVYTNGTKATVTATANPGYAFANWTDGGMVVSKATSYTFTNIINRSLVANYVPSLSAGKPQARTFTITWLTNFSGYALQQCSDLRASNWVNAAVTVGISTQNYQTTISLTNGSRFFRLYHP